MDISLLQQGDVVFFQGKSFISRGIRSFTKSKWSHVALYVGDGYIIEATGAGVEKNALLPLLGHASRVAVGRRKGLTIVEWELMKTRAYSMIGDKYDVWQLLTFPIYFALRKIGIIWPAIIGDKGGEVVCSAFVAMCFATIPVKFAKYLKSVSPETIYSSDEIEIIFEEETK